MTREARCYENDDINTCQLTFHLRKLASVGMLEYKILHSMHTLHGITKSFTPSFIVPPLAVAALCKDRPG